MREMISGTTKGQVWCCLFFFLSFATLTIFTWATTFEQVGIHHFPFGATDKDMCYTVWDISPSCWRSAQKMKVSSSVHKWLWPLAQASAVVLMLLLYTQFLLGFLVLSRGDTKKWILTISCFCTVLVGIVCATIFVSSSMDKMDTGSRREFGAGFKMLLVALVTQIFSFFALLQAVPTGMIIADSKGNGTVHLVNIGRQPEGTASHMREGYGGYGAMHSTSLHCEVPLNLPRLIISMKNSRGKCNTEKNELGFI
eukprot:gene5842-4166_t